MPLSDMGVVRVGWNERHLIILDQDGEIPRILFKHTHKWYSKHSLTPASSIILRRNVNTEAHQL